MKRSFGSSIFIILVLLITVNVFGANESWTHRRQITIKPEMVDDTGSADLENFPVYLELALGSNVYDDSINATDGGQDVRFALDKWGFNKLDHDTLWMTDTGTWYGYVSVPFVDYNSDTTIWVFYGCDTDNYCVPQENAQGVWDLNDNNETILYYGFEDNSSSCVDPTRNDNDGTWGSAFSRYWTPTPPVGVYYGIFQHGSNEYVEPDSTTFNNDLGSTYTFEAWIRFSADLSEYQAVFSGDSDDDYPLQIVIKPDWGLFYASGNDGTNNGRYTNDGGAYTQNVWYRIAVVVENGVVTSLWRDGTKCNLDGYYTQALDTEPARLGFDDDNVYHFSGLMDDIVISNVARSDQYLKTRYNNVAEYRNYEDNCTGSCIDLGSEESLQIGNSTYYEGMFHEKLLPDGNDVDEYGCNGSLANYTSSLKCYLPNYDFENDFNGNLNLASYGCNYVSEGVTTAAGEHSMVCTTTHDDSWILSSGTIYYQSDITTRVVDVRDNTSTWLTEDAGTCTSISAGYFCYDAANDRLYVNNGVGAPSGTWTFSYCSLLTDTSGDAPDLSTVEVGMSVYNVTQDETYQVVAHSDSDNLYVSGNFASGDTYRIGDNYQCVNDGSDSTYIFDSSSDPDAEKYDFFNFDNPLFIRGAILRATIYAKVAKTCTTASYTLYGRHVEMNYPEDMWELDTGSITSSSFYWVSYDIDLANDDPAGSIRLRSHDSWDLMHFGIGLSADSGTGEARCSEMVLEIEYREGNISKQAYIKGTATGTATKGFQLIDSNANFTTDIEAADVTITNPRMVINLTDGTYARVSQVLSDTKLGLSTDIFATNDDYLICPYHFNSLKNALDSINELGNGRRLYVEEGVYQEREPSQEFAHDFDSPLYIEGVTRLDTTNISTSSTSGAIFNINYSGSNLSVMKFTGAGSSGLFLSNLGFIYDTTSPNYLLSFIHFDSTNTGYSFINNNVFRSGGSAKLFSDGAISIDTSAQLYIAHNVIYNIGPAIEWQSTNSNALVFNNTVYGGMGGINVNGKRAVLMNNLVNNTLGTAFQNITNAVGKNNICNDSSTDSCADANWNTAGSTERLEPDSDITNDLTSTIGFHWQAINYAASQTTDYVSTTQSTYNLYDRYTLTDGGAFTTLGTMSGEVSIDSVDLYVYWWTDDTADYKVTIYDGTDTSIIENNDITGSSATTHTNITAPDGTWTSDDLAGLQLRLDLKVDSGTVRIYSCWLNLHYTAGGVGNHTDTTANFENASSCDLRLDDAYPSQTAIDNGKQFADSYFDSAYDPIYYLMEGVLGQDKRYNAWDIGAHELQDATTFYLSYDNGNDSNNGTSDSTEWKTITKLNQQTLHRIVKGDTVKLACGDVWYTYNTGGINLGNTKGITLTNYQDDVACTSSNRPRLDGKWNVSDSSCVWLQSNYDADYYYLADSDGTECSDSMWANYKTNWTGQSATVIYAEPTDKECGVECNSACSGTGASNEDGYPGLHCTGDINDGFYMPYGSDPFLNYTETHYPIEQGLSYTTLNDDQHWYGCITGDDCDTYGYSTIYMDIADGDPDTVFDSIYIPMSGSTSGIQCNQDWVVDGIDVYWTTKNGIYLANGVELKNFTVKGAMVDDVILNGTSGTRSPLGRNGTSAIVHDGKVSLAGRSGLDAYNLSHYENVYNVIGANNRQAGLRFNQNYDTIYSVYEYNEAYHNCLERSLNPYWSYLNMDMGGNTNRSIYERKKILRFNESYRSRMSDVKNADAGGLETRADNFIGYYNLIYKCDGSGYDAGRMVFTEQYHGNVHFYHNTLYDNSIVDSDKGGISGSEFSTDPGRGSYFENNIVYQNTSNSPLTEFTAPIKSSQLTLDYNFYFNEIDPNQSSDWFEDDTTPSPYDFTEWQGLGYDVHGAYGDQKVSSAEYGNFQLQTGSPCIDTSNTTPMNFLKEILILGDTTHSSGWTNYSGTIYYQSDIDKKVFGVKDNSSTWYTENADDCPSIGANEWCWDRETERTYVNNGSGSPTGTWTFSHYGDFAGNVVPNPDGSDPTKPDIGAFESQGGGIIPIIINYFRRRIGKLEPQTMNEAFASEH